MQEIAELLIERGAELEIRTSSGDTPASLAQQKNYTKIVDLVLSRSLLPTH